jgi:hypothetical protein
MTIHGKKLPLGGNLLRAAQAAKQTRQRLKRTGRNALRPSGFGRQPNKQQNGKNVIAVFVRFGQGARTMPCLQK